MRRILMLSVLVMPLLAGGTWRSLYQNKGDIIGSAKKLTKQAIQSISIKQYIVGIGIAAIIGGELYMINQINQLLHMRKKVLLKEVAGQIKQLKKDVVNISDCSKVSNNIIEKLQGKYIALSEFVEILKSL